MQIGNLRNGGLLLVNPEFVWRVKQGLNIVESQIEQVRSDVIAYEIQSNVYGKDFPETQLANIKDDVEAAIATLQKILDLYSDLGGKAEKEAIKFD